MRKLYRIIALLILSVVMLIVGIYIGRNNNRKGTITNTTNVDSIRYAIQQSSSGFPLILSAWNEKHWMKPVCGIMGTGT